ncbi:MAG: response regulator [Thermodesulfobacteriota bacterium]|nr:response regulator [Thermodesulfobacteriota bacterium]
MAFKSDKLEKSADILIVEDSSTQALQLQSLLEKSGYKVSVAANGAEAFSHLEDHFPDLVISDILMPEMDGYELCRKIKEDDDLKSIPVLLLTQLTEPEDIIKGLDAGADNFVTKPYDPKLLLSQIEYILVNRAMRTSSRTEIGMEVFFAGKKHFVNSDRMQILDLLFSTYQNSLQQKRELEKMNKELKEALDTINTLHGILPICANCKKIRDDKGAWSQVEEYIGKHSDVQFSHGICPECAKKLYPEFVKD